MVSKVDEFKTVVLAFDDVEVASIINALRYVGNEYLACEIEDEVYGECGGCECDESDDGPQLASLIFDIDTSSVEAATESLAKFAEWAERAADAAERIEEAYENERGHYLDLLSTFLELKGKQ